MRHASAQEPAKKPGDFASLLPAQDAARPSDDHDKYGFPITFDAEVITLNDLVRSANVDSLEQLLTREDAIDYVILEGSGVADPEGIVMTFLNPRYEGLLKLDSITCIIDAVGIFADGDNERLNLLKLRQIGFADMVVLNKTDLVGPEHIEVIREWIGHHMNRIRIIEATRCDVPLEVLLAVGRFDPVNVISQRENSNVEEHEHHHEHGDVGAMFQTWSYESDRPFSLKLLRQMVRRELPESIYRCKGIIFAADSPDKRLALQAVGRRTEISELDEWGERTRRTQIVAIGAAIDAQELSNKFDACLESPSGDFMRDYRVFGA